MVELSQKIQIAKIIAKDKVYKVQEKWQTSNTGKNSLTKDPAYNAANPKHFIPMMDEDRYSDRSDAFDKIISATHKHFWDPNDKKYIDFDIPFDIENENIVDPEGPFGIELQIPSIREKLSEKQLIKLNNESFRFVLSQILHGEQAALSLSASLCHVLRDPGAQEYAANQTREEARHVAGFTKYIQARWGSPYKVGPTLGRVANDIVSSDVVYKKIVGMQMMIEGLAMGAFAMAYENTNDPVLKTLLKYTMSDEAFHHKFGKIWADRTIPKLSKSEHVKVEDWAEKIFVELLFNLVNPTEKKHVYSCVGLDYKWVDQEFHKYIDQGEVIKDDAQYGYDKDGKSLNPKDKDTEKYGEGEKDIPPNSVVFDGGTCIKPVGDSREFPTIINLMKNKLRARGLNMSHEPEGKMIEGYQRDPEGQEKDRKTSKQSDPSKDNFTGISGSIATIMKQNAAMKKAAAKKVKKEEVVTELNRYGKETGKATGSLNKRPGTPVKSGGTSSPVMRAVRSSIRRETGKPEGQQKKERGKKPPVAGEYGARRSPAQIVQNRRASKAAADASMRDTRGT